MGLDAPALGDLKPMIASDVGQELTAERRLADSGLAGHEHDLTVTIHGARQACTQLVELPMTAHDEPGSERIHRRRLAGRGCGRRGRHGGDESVAAAVPGLDEARAPGIIGERASELLDACRERRVADDRVPPYRPEQLGARDGLPGSLDQHRQHGGRPGCELDLARAGPELPGPWIEAVTTEANFSSHDQSVAGASGPSVEACPRRASHNNLAVLLGLRTLRRHTLGTSLSDARLPLGKGGPR